MAGTGPGPLLEFPATTGPKPPGGGGPAAAGAPPDEAGVVKLPACLGDCG